QGEGPADLGRLLADERRIDGQLALPLQGGGLQVRPPRQRHQAVQLPELLFLEVEAGGVRARRAVDREDAEGLVAHPFLAQILAHARPPGTQYRRTRPIFPIRSRANASAAAEVETWRSRAMWKISRSVRYTDWTRALARSGL